MFKIYIYNLGTYTTVYTSVSNSEELENEIFKATNYGMNDYDIGILESPYSFKVDDLRALFKIYERFDTSIEDVGYLLQYYENEDDVIEMLEQELFYTIVSADNKVQAFEEYVHDYEIIYIPDNLEAYIDWERVLIDYECGGLLVTRVNVGKYLIIDK